MPVVPGIEAHCEKLNRLLGRGGGYLHPLAQLREQTPGRSPAGRRHYRRDDAVSGRRINDGNNDGGGGGGGDNDDDDKRMDRASVT